LPDLTTPVEKVLPLHSGETLVNSWHLLDWDVLLVLTDQRFAMFDVQVTGFFKATESYRPKLIRALESISEPRIGPTQYPQYKVMSVAGTSVMVGASHAEAIRDEIAHQRTRRLADVDSTRVVSPPAQREILTREIVRIPCHYCGQLMNQTDPKCPSCGAKL
jgi:hypothetical protein